MPLPASFLKSIEGIPGYNQAAFESVHEAGQQVTSLRINPGKWPEKGIDKLIEGYKLHQAKEIQSSAIAWCANGYYLSERPSFTFDPFLHGGAYYVQEASSMFIGYALEKVCGNLAGLKALDLCAAPGGKTTLLSSLHNISLLVSNELIRSRVPVLYENVVKWGSPHVFVSQNDPHDFQRLPDFFDILLIDAPCSGSGLFRRDPDAISEWSPNNVTLCSQRQQRILADALPSLKEDGLLFYSTCSYSIEENEHIIGWLIKEHDLESVRIEFPSSWNIVETSSDSAKAYGYRFYPDKVKGEGFFIGCFRKKSGSSGVANHAEKLEMAGTADRKVLCEWINAADDFEYIQKNDAYMAVPHKLLSDFNTINKNLSLRKSGTRMGNLIRGKLNPDHELAMSLILNRNLPSFAINYTDAIRFLRKETIKASTDLQGWVLVEYDKLPLGFLKCMPNRANNYYPSDWRIRSESPFKQ
jgi:16S rRNA C967 or C1407 C5-methylase (RsmB/RsmF family)/NOL1/NOP2/fmu family ribosome biogenesis protein